MTEHARPACMHVSGRGSDVHAVAGDATSVPLPLDTFSLTRPGVLKVSSVPTATTWSWHRCRKSWAKSNTSHASRTHFSGHPPFCLTDQIQDFSSPHSGSLICLKKQLAELKEVLCFHLLSRFSRVQLCETLCPVALLAPLSMGFARQEYWARLSCSPPGEFPNPGTELMSSLSLALADRLFTASANLSL